MKTKIFAVLAMFFLVTFSMFGCSGSDSSDGDNDSGTPSGFEGGIKTFDFSNSSEVNAYSEYEGANAAVLDRDEKVWTIPANGYNNLAFRTGLTKNKSYVFIAKFKAEEDGNVTIWAGDSSDGSIKYDSAMDFAVNGGETMVLEYEFTSDTSDSGARIGFKCKTANEFEFTYAKLEITSNSTDDDFDDSDSDDTGPVDDGVSGSVKVFDFQKTTEVNHYTEFSGTSSAAIFDRDDKTWEIMDNGYNNLAFRAGVKEDKKYVFIAKFRAEQDGIVTIWAGDNEDESIQYDDDLRFSVVGGEVNILRYEFTSDTTDAAARIVFKCKLVNYFEFITVQLTTVN